MSIHYKPKLLIIIGNLDLGGAEKHLWTVLPRLKTEYDIVIFTTSFAGNFHHEFAKAGIPVVYKYLMGSNKKNKVAQVLRLGFNFLRALRYIKHTRPDIIHFFLPGSYLLGGYAALLLGRKNLIMSRRSQNDYQRKHPKLATVMEYYLHRKMDVILANSQKVAMQLKEEGVTDTQLQLIYNGVDLNRYSLQAVSGLREELGIGPDTLVLTIVANLFFYKGHADLFQALFKIKADFLSDWVLLCIGRDTGELKNLQQLASELGLGKQIRFLLQRQDVAQLISISDIGILASHEEGFSNAILEFMASGKPMVVTDVGGNAEAILHNQCGLVVPAKDSSAMAQALLTLMNDSILRQSFGHAARVRAEQNFSLDACVNAYDHVYKSLSCSGSGATASPSASILFVINNIEFLYSHRLPIVLAAAEQGYTVHVATCFKAGVELKHQDKITYHYIHFNRNSMNPITELKPLGQLVKLYRRLRPDVIHHMCKKSVLYGCLITRFMKNIPVVNTMPGLGYLFISQSAKANTVRMVLRHGFRFGFNRPHLKTIFQNDDDRTLFLTYGVVKQEQCVMIRGSGVDVDEFTPKELCTEPTTVPLVVLPARLLWDKGVGEFVEAARALKESVQARFVLVGDVDLVNPASVSPEMIRSWVAEGVIEHWGWRTDMVSVLQEADIVCLPSYREGMPKALLEAAACGLPIVTTNAPGCRDVIVHGDSGFIAPVKDSVLLAEYLRQLIESATLRNTMGAQARERVVQLFSTRIIVAEHLNLYQELYKLRSSRTCLQLLD